MIVLALVLLLAQAPTPSPAPMPSYPPLPQMPTTQQMMRLFAQFRPELTESRRQLMGAVMQALTPQQITSIATDIGADAVSDEPDPAKLTSEIDGVLTPSSRTAIVAAFTQYAVRQQQISKQIQAAMPMQQSGDVNASLAGPGPQPIAFVPADAARLLAHQPIGMGVLSSGSSAGIRPLVSPIMQLRETMRAQMLAALTPEHRIAVGDLYGKAAMNESDAAQNAVPKINALLAPAERQAILSAHAQFIADSEKQLEAMKATAQQQIQAMGAQVPPALLDMMQRQLDALHAPPPTPVDAGSALFSALLTAKAAP